MKEGNKYPDTGSTEGPKQDETKQDLHQDILIIMTKEYEWLCIEGDAACLTWAASPPCVTWQAWRTLTLTIFS